MTTRQETGVSKGAVLLIAAMSSFLTPFTASSIFVALPSIDKSLGLNAVALSWVSTAYLLAAAMFLVPFGRIADINGRKKIFRLGIIIDVIASILCAVSSSGMWLIFFRAMQGLGGAMILGNGVAILTSVFPPKERGRALGITTASVYSGLSMGPLLGGFLTQHLGWRSIFFMNALLGLIVMVFVFWKLKGEWAEARGEKFDYAGAIVYSLSLVALMSGFSLLPKLPAVGLILIGVLGLMAFIMIEVRSKSPVLNVGFFRNNTVFAFSNLAALINYSATFVVGFLLSLYLQYIRGFTPEHAGLILMAQFVMMAVCSPIAGNLSDRIEPRIVASVGMALTTTGLLLLTFLGNDTGIGYILISLIILGTGFGFFSSPNTNAVMGSIEKKFYGVAAGMLSTMRLTGQMLSLGMALLLFTLYIGRVQITPEYYPSLLKSVKVAFMISTILCFAAIFASIARGKTRE